MQARHIIDLISDEGKILKTSIYSEEFKDIKDFDKEMVKRFSRSDISMNIKELTYKSSVESCGTKIYSSLKHMKYFNEFKAKYGYPKMYKTSYMRVLEGKSTYIDRNKSPYIVDVFKFIADKLNKSFLEVASDLLDSEYLGRKTTLLDVLVAEENVTKEYIFKLLELDAKLLDTFKLCELSLVGKQCYDEMKSKLEESL